MADITALDYILLPFYLWLIYKIAFYSRDKLYPENHPLRPYFISGLTVKIIGALFIGFIYGYYYQGGDTFGFFLHSKVINSNLLTAPDTWFRLMTHSADDRNLADGQSLSKMYWYDDISTYTVARIGALIGLFCFTKYLVINIIIASIVFIGNWLMFITFATQYKNTKLIALAVLFMPGPAVWGSGLFKDSFCMFAIGCLVYCVYILFDKKQFKLPLILLSLLSLALLLLIKAYILIALFPVLIFKILLLYKKRVKGKPLKQIVFYLVFFLVCFGIYIGGKIAADALTKVNTDGVLATVKVQKDYLLGTNDSDGSFYDLGDFDPSVQGIVKLILPAINVTLFRPYPWETRQVIQILNSMESTIILIVTCYLLIIINPFKIIKYTYRDSNLIMCLSFTLIFAFFVGISSYNFGALSRYKIPCTPFYMLFLTILFSKKQDEDAIYEKENLAIE